METVTHNQQFCSVKKRAIQKIDRVYGAVCPFCGIELPSKNRAVFVEVGDDGNAIRSRAVPLKPFWKRNGTIVAIVVFVVFGWLVIASNDSGGSGSPTVVTQGATRIVDSDLLGDGNYTGSGSYAVFGANKAYSSEYDATAVAARISVPGEDSLCLFWYMGGRSPCGREHVSWSISTLPRTMERQAALSTGNGYLMCAICQFPLADHAEIFTHELSELSLRRLRSSGVPWQDRPSQVGQGSTSLRSVNE